MAGAYAWLAEREYSHLLLAELVVLLHVLRDLGVGFALNNELPVDLFPVDLPLIPDCLVVLYRLIHVCWVKSVA